MNGVRIHLPRQTPASRGPAFGDPGRYPAEMPPSNRDPQSGPSGHMALPVIVRRTSLTDQQQRRNSFLRSCVATYLERDLRQLLQVSNLRDYERFLCAAALRSAHLPNRADLARDMGISGSTAAWLSALEATHQLMVLEPWFAKRTKTLVKRPMLHLRDAGLAAFLAKRRWYIYSLPLLAARRHCSGELLVIGNSRGRRSTMPNGRCRTLSSRSRS